jgi:hypothetical protein
MEPTSDPARPRRSARITPPRGRAVLAIWLTIALAGLAPAYVVAFTQGTPRSEGWILTVAVMAWAGLRLAFLIAAGEARFFELFLWLYVYIFLGLAPTVQIRTNLVSGTTPDMDPALDVPAAGVVILGLVSYEVFRGLAILRESRRGPRPVDPRDRSALDMDSTRLMLLGLLGAAASAYVVATLGVAVFFGSREAASVARIAAFPDPAVREIILALGLFPILVASGGIAQKLRANRHRGQRLALQACLLVSLILVFLVVSPISSARYTLGTVLFAVAVYLGATRTAFRIRVTMAACVGGFLVVFPVADSFRREGGTLGRGTGFIGEYAGNSDYDSFWQIANAYSYWRDGLVEPLGQALGSVFFAVPRSIWPGKPTDTGILLADYRGYDFSNLSAPLWAEALVNGGLVAVVLLFAAVGYLLRALDTRLAGAMSGASLWALVGGLFPVYSTILLRGSLLQATGPLVIAVGCVLVIRAAHRRRDATRADPQAEDPTAAYSSSSRRATADMLNRSRT